METTNVQSAQYQHDVDKVTRLIKNIQTSMLTSISPETNMLVSRPMQLSYFDKEKRLVWFFTKRSSAKAQQLMSRQGDDRVSVAFSDPTNQHYVSLSGRAEIVDNATLVKRWWKSEHESIFDQGSDDPNVVLVKIHCQQAQFWDTKENQLQTLWHNVASKMTGKTHMPHHEQATVTLDAK